MAETRQINADQFISIYVTCPDQACAEQIAHALLDAQLIGCANLIDGARSLYRWQGEIADDRECVMIMKGRADHFPLIEETIRARHPYDVPCIIAWPFVAGHAPYLDWLADETDAPPHR